MPTSYVDPVLGVAYIFSDPTDLRYFNEYANRLVAVVQHPAPQRIYMFDEQSEAPDDGSTVLKPYSILPADPGRWILEGVGTAPGANSFLALTDTPATYAGHAGESVVVNGTATGLVFGSSTLTSCVECPYMDNPGNWAGGYVPETIVAAVQSVTRHIYFHYGAKITSTAVGGSGCPYKDDSTYWTGAVPLKITDALRDVAAALAGHIGFPIPNIGISSGCSPFTDAPANWATGVAPASVLEAAQCIVAALVNHMGYRVADFTRFSDNEARYVAHTVADWKDGNAPLTVEMAIRSGVHALSLHLGAPLTPTVTGWGGAPYEDDAGFWVGSAPQTTLDALLSLINEIVPHIGSPLTNVVSDDGTVPFTDPNPTNWVGGMSRTIMEATQTAISFLAAHLGQPVRRVVDPRMAGPESHYVDDSTRWDYGEWPRTINDVLDNLAAEYFNHVGSQVPGFSTIATGSPYQKNPTHWSGVGATTVAGAIQSLAQAIKVHSGALIPDTGFRAGLEIYEDPLVANWINADPPLTLMEAAQCCVLALSTHLSRPLHNTDAQTFLNLLDSPSTYLNEANKSVVVNPGETGVQFIEMGRFDATFVVANGTTPWNDTVHDCSASTYLHVNNPIPGNPPLVDGVKNAIDDCVLQGYGLIHIKRGIYDTLASAALVQALVRGEGAGNTVIRLLDDTPSTTWFLEFTGNEGGIEDIGIEIPALVGAPPNSVIFLNGQKNRVREVQMSLTGTTPEAALGAILIAENDSLVERFFYNDGPTGISQGMTGIRVGSGVATANATRILNCNINVNSLLRHGIAIYNTGGSTSGAQIDTCEVIQQYANLGHAIYVTGTSCEKIHINHNNVTGGINFADGSFYDCHVESNEVQYFGQHGIALLASGGAGQFSDGVIVDNNIVRDAAGDPLLIPCGISLGGSTNKQYHRNRLVENRVNMGNFNRDPLWTTELAGIACGMLGGFGIGSGNSLIGNTVRGAGQNQTGIFMQGCWNSVCNSNHIWFDGLPSVIVRNDGCIKLVNCKHMTLNSNEMYLIAAYGKGISISGDPGNSIGFTLNGNEIELRAGVPFNVKGIEVEQFAGVSPTKLSIVGNTVVRTSNISVGIDVPDNAVNGTCVGNTTSGGPINALNLGTGITAGLNDTT